jgi:hypothetical protein
VGSNPTPSANLAVEHQISLTLRRFAVGADSRLRP